jgi:hypothetical protein
MRPWRLVVDEVWREEEKVKYVRKINEEKKKIEGYYRYFTVFNHQEK